MAVTYLGVWSNGAQGVTSFSTGIPSGLSLGDLMIVTVLAHRTGGGSFTTTPPSGWTLINDTPATDGTSYVHLYTYYRFYQTGDSTFNWSFSETVDVVSICVGYRGHDPVNPVPVNSEATDTDGGTTCTATGITMPRNGMIVGIFGCRDAAPRSCTAPSGMTSRYTIATNRPTYADISLMVCDESVSSGSTGNKTCTWDSGVDIGVMQLVGVQEPFLGYHMII